MDGREGLWESGENRQWAECDVLEDGLQQEVGCTGLMHREKTGLEVKI